MTWLNGTTAGFGNFFKSDCKIAFSKGLSNAKYSAITINMVTKISDTITTLTSTHDIMDQIV